MKTSDVCKALGVSPAYRCYSVEVARAYGITAAVLFTHIGELALRDGADVHAWVRRSLDQILSDTGLTRRQYITARNLLADANLLAWDRQLSRRSTRFQIPHGQMSIQFLPQDSSDPCHEAPRETRDEIDGRRRAKRALAPRETRVGAARNARSDRAKRAAIRKEQDLEEEPNLEEHLCADELRASDNNDRNQDRGQDRNQDLLWESLVDGLGLDRAEITTSARGSLNAALVQIRAAGGTPEQVHVRVAEYRRRFPGWNLTPTALAKHWPVLGSPTTSARSKTAAYRDAPDEAYVGSEIG